MEGLWKRREDNLDRPDGYCWREDITGKVVLVEPWWILFAPQMAAVALGVVLFQLQHHSTSNLVPALTIIDEVVQRGTFKALEAGRKN